MSLVPSSDHSAAPAPAPPAGPPRVVVDGIPVAAFTSPEALFAHVLELAQTGRARVVKGLNVHGANLAHDLPWLRDAYRRADVVYCDGVGIVLGARLLGRSLPPRLTAADWLEDLLRLLAARGMTAYFFGGTPRVAELAREHFASLAPGRVVVHTHHGYVLDNPALERRVLEEINRLRPDVLFVGLGMPLQERWIEEHRHELDVGVAWALGATLDLLTGRLRRAPPWMRRLGLEWLFRLAIEPRRLFARYVVGIPRYLLRIVTADRAVDGS